MKSYRTASAVQISCPVRNVAAAAVHARFDSVIVGQWRCPIDEIRKVDYRRMRADLRLEAQSRKTQAAQ